MTKEQLSELEKNELRVRNQVGFVKRTFGLIKEESIDVDLLLVHKTKH